MAIDPKRVKEIFLEAAELSDETARAAYLDKACGADAGVRERVEALLRSHDPDGSFLGVPAAVVPDPDRAATRDFPPDPEHAATRTSDSGASASDDEPLTFLSPPTRPDSLGRLGHYEVLQVLGKGGFGIVFRAFDEMLQRVVALKVLAPQLAATSPARKRFLREARSSAQVRHENVVQVYEVTEQPLPYLAMEFIPGETLQQKLDRVGPLDVPETLRIGQQIAEGLAAAHATDLIHRDIKPGNILLEGGQHKVKITDFGLARAADDASISQSGIIAGTPMYMAPEQAQGQTLDQRADLFSLGSVLYQMVAGRPPFRANNTVAVLKRVAEDQPRAIREIIPETPQWLCDIIAKLHAKDPDDRYQSAREVVDVLADCDAQLKADSKLKDYSRIPRVKQRQSGRRKWAAAALVLVALAGVGVYALTRPGPNPTGPGTGTEPPRSTAVAWGEFTDPLGDCRLNEENDRLTISVPGDRLHDLNPLPGRNLNAPRVLREVAGDFEARVTVLPYPPPTSVYSTGPNPPYVGAGLVVWSDEAGILRLDRAYSGGSFVQAEWYNGLAPGGSKWIPVPEGPMHLRIRRTGDTMHLASSTDGQSWTEAATAANLRPVSRVRVGVVVVNAIKQDFTVQFEGFEIKELPSSLSPATEAQDASARQSGIPVETTNSIGMKLRLIPPGKFTMGSPKEEIDRCLKQFGPYKENLPTEGPEHPVEITQPFYLGATEITVGQFRQFVDEEAYQVGDGRWRNPGFDQTDQHPVVFVSWNNAVDFCKWLSKKEGKEYRLPTEAEWEYSCRAGKAGSRYGFGDDDAQLKDYAWFDQNSGGGTHPVGKKKPNAWGLYDMHGNAWEWCQDNYDPDYYKNSPVKDPPGGAGGARAGRGGGWLHGPVLCRSAFRGYLSPDDHIGAGFRVLVVSPPAGVGTESVAKNKPAVPAIAPFTDADVQRIAALPAAEQVEEVRKELKRRNPNFDGKMDLKIEGGVVTEFRIVTDQVTDIAPIRVFNALRILDCHGTWTGKANGQLADLTPLKGMNLAGLTGLNLECTQVSDTGMVYFKDCKNLRYLNLGGTTVGDAGLIHFKGCKDLTSLELALTQVSDVGLAHFKDCKNLTALNLNWTGVGDAGLIHFKDCKDLTRLTLGWTQMSDVGLAHFKDCKNLTDLTLDNTKVGDAGLAHFKGMPLKFLTTYNTTITDLTPLVGMPLEDLRLTPKNITKGLDILRDMKSLKTIGISWEQVWPAAEFWERYDKGEIGFAFTDADVKRIAALPAPQQVEEVRKELMRRNPGFDGKMEHKIEEGVVTEFKIVTDQVKDIAPIRVFKALRVLVCSGTLTGKPNGLLADLTPLAGMNLAGLTHLGLWNTKVTDSGMVYFKDCKALTGLALSGTNVSDAGLIHFQDCKALTYLALNGTKVSDAGLVYFKDCKALTNLILAGTNVSDAGLANFKDCKNLTELWLHNTQVGETGMVHFQDCKALTHLNLAWTKVGDAGLAHFKGMPLKVLWIDDTGISDLTPLQGMSLEEIHLTPKNITKGLDILRAMKSLKTISIRWDQGWPAAEFWERYEKGEFK